MIIKTQKEVDHQKHWKTMCWRDVLLINSIGRHFREERKWIWLAEALTTQSKPLLARDKDKVSKYIYISISISISIYIQKGIAG